MVQLEGATSFVNRPSARSATDEATGGLLRRRRAAGCSRFLRHLLDLLASLPPPPPPPLRLGPTSFEKVICANTARHCALRSVQFQLVRIVVVVVVVVAKLFPSAAKTTTLTAADRRDANCERFRRHGTVCHTVVCARPMVTPDSNINKRSAIERADAIPRFDESERSHRRITTTSLSQTIIHQRQSSDVVSN